MVQGNFTTAQELLNKSLTYNPDSISSHLVLGNVYKALGNFDNALKSYNNALKIDPNYVHAMYGIATILKLQGKLDEAIDYCNKAYKLAANFWQALNALGSMYYEKGAIDDAEATLLKGLEIAPNNVAICNNLAGVYRGVNANEQALKYYQRSIEINPNQPMIHNYIGLVLVKMDGLEEAAIDSYEKALELDPNNEYARLNLSLAHAKLVPEWHFSMLADVKRNGAYEKAINKVITPDSTVLDIGTGSGLLAMMAARAGAKHVTACEACRSIANSAKKIVSQNGLDEKIKVINKSSKSLKLGEDMDSRANVLVSEILDTGLLGEHVLPTYRHAIEHLVTDNAIIIPASAKIICTLVELPKLTKSFPIKEVCGFNLSEFNELRSKHVSQTINLSFEEHVFVSDEIMALEISFSNLPPKADYLNPNKTLIKTKAAQAGRIDAIVYWFDLCIYDDIIFSTRPERRDLKHWKQAIYYLDNSREVSEGEEITLEVLQSDLSVCFKLL